MSQVPKGLLFKDFIAALRARGRAKEAEHFQQLVKDKFQNEFTQNEIDNLSIDDITAIIQIHESFLKIWRCIMAACDFV